MKKIIVLIVTLSLNSLQCGFGQNVCNTESIIGKWKFSKDIHWGIDANVDSLKSITQEDTLSTFFTIQFNNDNTYIFGNGKKYDGYYFFDIEKCEIILNRNKKRLKNEKYRERSNLEIIYIDKEILIYKEDNNPKNYATHVLLRN